MTPYIVAGIVLQCAMVITGHYVEAVLNLSALLGVGIPVVLGAFYGAARPEGMRDAVGGGFWVGFVGADQRQSKLPTALPHLKMLPKSSSLPHQKCYRTIDQLERVFPSSRLWESGKPEGFSTVAKRPSFPQPLSPAAFGDG